MTTPEPREDHELAEPEFERWAEIRDDPKAIAKCGDRWQAVAQTIGCTLHGFNDGRSASFATPDGNVIDVGPKWRTAIMTANTGRAEVLEEAARVAEDKTLVVSPYGDMTQRKIAAAIRALSSPPVTTTPTDATAVEAEREAGK